jgi:hypothetical protein
MHFSFVTLVFPSIPASFTLFTLKLTVGSEKQYTLSICNRPTVDINVFSVVCVRDCITGYINCLFSQLLGEVTTILFAG